jgi:hypothetical protein
MNFDPIDVALSIGLMISGFIVTDIATFELFGVDFGATALTLAGYDLETALVLGALSFGGIILTNDNTSFSELRDDVDRLSNKTGDWAAYYAYSIIGTIALMVGWVVFPDTVASFFQSSDLWGLLYVSITTAGGYVAGWIL